MPLSCMCPGFHLIRGTEYCAVLSAPPAASRTSTSSWRGGAAINENIASCSCDQAVLALSQVALVVWWLVCLPLDPKVAGLNPAKATDF
jgi:hypothetical protein